MEDPDPLWPDHYLRILEHLWNHELELFGRCYADKWVLRAHLSCSLAGSVVLLHRLIIEAAEAARGGPALDPEAGIRSTLETISKVFPTSRGQVDAAIAVLDEEPAIETPPCIQQRFRLATALLGLFDAITAPPSP